MGPNSITPVTVYSLLHHIMQNTCKLVSVRKQRCGCCQEHEYQGTINIKNVDKVKEYWIIQVTLDFV